MTSGAADGQVDLEPVVACVLREKEAVAAGDAAGYLGVLSGDAVFMPPGSGSKSGEGVADVARQVRPGLVNRVAGLRDHRRRG
jgi:hypothetical protein